MRKKPFVEVMDLKGFQCIQRNNTLGSGDSRFDCFNCHSSNLYF
jgi:hypothetical protein